jgi:excisionase family DNA binding protein
MPPDACPLLPRGSTVRDIARRYRVGEDTVRRWIRSGELAAINTARVRCGKPRFVVTPEALEKFERARQAETTTPNLAPRRRLTTGLIDYYPD